MVTVSPTAIEAITRSEIEVQIEIAKRYPRDITKVIKQAHDMATVNRGVAASCIYAVPRAGKAIEGPSVRLAQIIAAAWTNLRVAARIVDENERFVTAQGVCHDMETNVTVSVEVARRITDRHGRRFNDDMVGVTSNAAKAIALRNAIFKVVPHVYTQQVYEAAKKTAIGDAKDFATRCAEMFAYFAKMGIFPDRILAVMGREKTGDFTAEDLGVLNGLATAIRDGDTTVDQAFPPVAPQASGVEGLREAKAAKAATEKPPEQDKPAKAPVEAEPPPDIPWFGPKDEPEKPAKAADGQGARPEEAAKPPMAKDPTPVRKQAKLPLA